MNVYNGVSLVPAGGPRPPARPPFQLLALGRLVPKKGFPVLLAACRLLAPQGVEVPPHPGRGRPGAPGLKIREMIHRAGAGPGVSLPGFVPHREVARLMAGADLLVMPSLIAPSGDRDGIPNVILEALLCEVPVVASAVSGIPEVIRRRRHRLADRPGGPRSPGPGRGRGPGGPGGGPAPGGRGRELVSQEFDSLRNYARLKALLEGAAPPPGAPDRALIINQIVAAITPQFSRCCQRVGIAHCNLS